MKSDAWGAEAEAEVVASVVRPVQPMRAARAMVVSLLFRMMSPGTGMRGCSLKVNIQLLRVSRPVVVTAR
ncbi:hypothetical protein GCM10023075_16120 [Streptosporangium album]